MMFKLLVKNLIFFIFFQSSNAIELNKKNIGILCNCNPKTSDYIYLANKNITAIDSATFEFSDPKRLDLSSNQIKVVNPATFNSSSIQY